MLRSIMSFVFRSYSNCIFTPELLAPPPLPGYKDFMDSGRSNEVESFIFTLLKELKKLNAVSFLTNLIIAFYIKFFINNKAFELKRSSKDCFFNLTLQLIARSLQRSDKLSCFWFWK